MQLERASAFSFTRGKLNQQNQKFERNLVCCTNAIDKVNYYCTTTNTNKNDSYLSHSSRDQKVSQESSGLHMCCTVIYYIRKCLLSLSRISKRLQVGTNIISSLPNLSIDQQTNLKHSIKRTFRRDKSEADSKEYCACNEHIKGTAQHTYIGIESHKNADSLRHRWC